MSKSCCGVYIVLEDRRLDRFMKFLKRETELLKVPNHSLNYTLILVTVLVLVTLAVYKTGGAKTAVPHLYYLPIVATGIIRGRAWGAVTGLVCGMASGPFMPLDAGTGALQHPTNWVIRICFFALVGYVSGITSSIMNAQNRQLSRKNKELNATLEALTTAFARAIDAKDSYTGDHSENVARYAVMLGREVGLSQDDLECLFKAGILHDIGKIAIPDRVLNKPGRLTQDEYDLIKQHPQHGYDILRPIPELYRCAKLVLYHHKGFSHGGYPDITEGDAVPLGARILAIADAWDAMTSDRKYRKALSRDEAIKRLLDSSGTQFDPELVSKFAVVINRGQDISRGQDIKTPVQSDKKPRYRHTG